LPKLKNGPFSNRFAFVQILMPSTDHFADRKSSIEYTATIAAHILRPSDFTAPNVVRTAQYPIPWCFARLLP